MHEYEFACTIELVDKLVSHASTVVQGHVGLVGRNKCCPDDKLGTRRDYLDNNLANQVVKTIHKLVVSRAAHGLQR